MIYVWQNNGAATNQAIGHLHFHAAGVRDGESTEWGKVPELPLEATDAIAARLKDRGVKALARFPGFSLTSDRGDLLDA